MFVFNLLRKLTTVSTAYMYQNFFFKTHYILPLLRVYDIFPPSKTTFSFGNLPLFERSRSLFGLACQYLKRGVHYGIFFQPLGHYLPDKKIFTGLFRDDGKVEFMPRP